MRARSPSGLIDDASGHINRGVGLLRARVSIMETDNAHLLCLDARSGNLIWDVAYADWNKNYGATGAPLIVNGQSTSGHVRRRRWRAWFSRRLRCRTTGKLIVAIVYHSRPRRICPASESWPGDSYLHGGGTAWMPGTYDQRD